METHSDTRAVLQENTAQEKRVSFKNKLTKTLIDQKLLTMSENLQ